MRLTGGCLDKVLLEPVGDLLDGSSNTRSEIYWNNDYFIRLEGLYCSSEVLHLILRHDFKVPHADSNSLGFVFSPQMCNSKISCKVFSTE